MDVTGLWPRWYAGIRRWLSRGGSHEDVQKQETQLPYVQAAQDGVLHYVEAQGFREAPSDGARAERDYDKELAEKLQKYCMVRMVNGREEHMRCYKVEQASLGRVGYGCVICSKHVIRFSMFSIKDDE